ncbi:aminoglycoside phosphotransferase family protein [Paractinoplanes abujensis]|uniref:Ser/Thr protein kinase RdoA (MazF antagonist) n=1 Tax=Paractinoplanes abujensis TaxID=882441 RepID=A0A7W7CR71_9ACTN|nr:aminoglycoside phosphotransferase family protein [Actinoplanes abujensis]MBB4691446.1 Ser/Thr protein kinase RdoA (MazF antagonist) [Actinoplanes abujensis]
MEILSGGGINEVVKIGDSVRRPAGPWSANVHALLRHLRAAGFTNAPEVRSTADGYEFLSYLPGDVSNYPLTPAAESVTALTSAAKLLRAYHDATVPFARTAPRDGWQVPARDPVEVICHGDYAPHNCALDGTTVTGVFDFDFAHPGPRLWDIAYAAYRWVPLTTVESDLPATVQAERLRTFCDTYGLDAESRSRLIDTVAARLHALVDVMQTRAAAGDKAFASHLADGHHTIYLTDADYVLAVHRKS